ncbi:MAG: hypothetical protein LBT84_04975, partial [Spirochaetia bacterium]|jgi:positive regulator of sigma E activity|nr:hypothetical protein [Spirochaetia bacterium]
VLLLIAGVVLGYVLAPGLGFDRDVSAEIGGIIGLLAFIIILALISRVIKKRHIFYPVLLDSTAPDSQNLS